MDKYKELAELQQKTRALIDQNKFEEAEKYREKASVLMKELYSFTTIKAKG